LPTQAYLTAGYGPFSETFLSKVNCDLEKWVVGARSGEVVFKGDKDGKGGGDGGSGLFEYLDTIWKLEELSKATLGEEAKTNVELIVRFKFRSAVHAAMMSAVEGQVAGMMIEAFEKRVKDVEGKGR
jgi:coenzyme Q-binding protein COQ10